MTRKQLDALVSQIIEGEMHNLRFLLNIIPPNQTQFKMKKYKVVSDCLKWPKGTEIEHKRMPHCKYAGFYAIGFGAQEYIMDSDMNSIISQGWAILIEEEKVKDYKITFQIIQKDQNGKVIGQSISTVRRLSDGVEFKVGQTIEIMGYAGSFKIKCFTEQKDGRLLVTLISGGGILLSEISPLPEKKVLFTTEDGVKVYEGDRCYFVIKNEYTIHEWRAKNDGNADSLLDFSTREAAEEWVIKNKPTISIADLENKTYDTMNGMLINLEDFKDLARERCGFKPE